MFKRRGTGNCPIGFMFRVTGCSFCAAQCVGSLLKRERDSGDRPPTCLLHLGLSSFDDHFLPRTPAAVGDDDPKWHAAAPIPSERNHLSLLLDPPPPPGLTCPARSRRGRSLVWLFQWPKQQGSWHFNLSHEQCLWFPCCATEEVPNETPSDSKVSSRLLFPVQEPPSVTITFFPGPFYIFINISEFRVIQLFASYSSFIRKKIYSQIWKLFSHR
jgi:hypothetical protein